METHIFVWSTLNFCYVNLKAFDQYSQVSLSSSSFLFLYLLLFPHDFFHTWTWFHVLFLYIVVLLDPWIRVAGIWRFHRSSYFVLLPHIKSLYVQWKRHCYQEGLYSTSVSADISFNNSWLTVFPQLHKESTCRDLRCKAWFHLYLALCLLEEHSFQKNYHFWFQDKFSFFFN